MIWAGLGVEKIFEGEDRVIQHILADAYESLVRLLRRIRTEGLTWKLFDDWNVVI